MPSTAVNSRNSVSQRVALSNVVGSGLADILFFVGSDFADTLSSVGSGSEVTMIIRDA